MNLLHRMAVLVCAGVLAGACKPRGAGQAASDSTPLPPRTADSLRRAAASPDTTPPADISHGEAPVGGPGSSPAPFLAQLAPREQGSLHHVRMEMRHATVEVAPGVKYAAWTFNGQVPGPVLRVRQGDTVDFTLTNKADIPHSMDFHAAEIAPDKYYRNLMPGDSIQYRFVARVPGAFLYHCGTAPVAMHIANGMYGALIVDPRTPLPRAEELVLVQSEFYLTRNRNPEGAYMLDWFEMLGQAPDHVVFNGKAAQYSTHPIDVEPNQLLRLYIVNAGPNRPSAFHVVGGIFERVFLDGSMANPLRGVQTVAVPVGGGSIFEIRLREAGEYPFVSHAFADATKGAVGVLRALDPGASPPENRPPMQH